MIDLSDSQSITEVRELSVRALLRRDGAAILGICAATLVVTLGTYAWGLAAGAGMPGATLGALAAASIWTALAAAPLAAGGSDGVSALLRGGIVADASALALIVLWLTSPFVTLLGAIKIYCTLLAMALSAVAAVRIARTVVSRYVTAVIVSVVMMVFLATPFWIGGLLKFTGGPVRETVVKWGVFVNPFYSVSSAIAERTQFVWHEAAVLYGLTRIGDYAAPPPSLWYAGGLLYGAGALILTAVNILKSLISRHRCGRIP